jgi:hypothetical protein
MKMQMNGAFVNKIVYIVSFFFLITGIAILLHHHDIPPKLAGCKICKVKYSFTGPQYKAAADSPFAVAVGYARFREMLPVTPELTGAKAYRAPSSIALLIYLNKSPPVYLV